MTPPDVGPHALAFRQERDEAERARAPNNGTHYAPPPNGPEDYGVAADSPAPRKPNGEPPVAALNWFTAASLAGKPVPPRSWFVRDMIPDDQVTLLSGDGGTGKSTIAEQLAVGSQIPGAEWLGQLPDEGPAVFASAEEDQDELHRRLVEIAASYGAELNNLPNLHFTSLAGADAVMGAPDKGGIIRETAVWRALLAKIEQVKPRSVFIDPLADVFAGNENDRAQARQFIGMLRRIAIKYHCPVLLLNHPSLSGMASGAGTSGSTGWNNSVRSRMYFDRVRGEDGVEIDPDLRVLRVMKANYGPVGTELRLRWAKGVFRLDGQSSGTFDRMAADAKADSVFMDLLAEFERQGRDASSKKSPTYAPSVFAKHPHAGGITKRAFESAMERLFMAKRIAVENTGSPSRPRSRIVLATEENEQ
jgi:RecA-family ATPase